MTTEKTTVRWPAEWEPQTAVWLAWPHNRETWPGRFAAIPRAFRAFCQTVAEFTPVRIIAADDAQRNAEKNLTLTENIEIIPIATNDCWIRDYGPTFVQSSDSLLGIDWRYNAWGGKYPPWDQDAEAARRLCEQLSIPRQESSFCLEGGAIEGNGAGIVLTTEECLLAETRNPGSTRADLENELTKRLGAAEIVWLSSGTLAGDDTDGHIDQVARFVAADTIVFASCDDPDDPNHHTLAPYREQLTSWATRRSTAIQLVPLPVPPPRFIEGQRVPQSYCNFLITNDLVLVPQFESRDADDRAMGVLTELFPRHHVRGLDASDLVWGLGAFHCASQQQPAPRPLRPQARQDRTVEPTAS